MLATEAARYPPARDPMAASFHTRGHTNTSFGQSTMAGRYGSGANYGNGGLFPAPVPSSNGPANGPPPPPSGFPQMNQNIMNQRAKADSSLYQTCVNLRKRLAEVPGFHEHIAEIQEEEAEANDATDPVTSMWNCLRRGFPLMTIYNAFRPAKPLTVDPNISEAKMAKHAAFKFLQACLQDLKFPPAEMFLITDLYGENTTGFVKVTKIVNRVLDILQQKGLLMARKRSTSDSNAGRPQTQTIRQKIVNELIETERDYINHLENLQLFKKELEEHGTLPGDAIHDIFLNLDSLLEFQRRFQVRLEQQFSSAESAQQWGKVFWHYADGFGVYVPFIANQDTCQKTVSKEWDKLRNATISKELHGIVETQSVLLSFLSKPFQRLTKYPMLLDELRKKGGLDPERQKDLEDGAEKARSVLVQTNEAIAKEARVEAVAELQHRVEDWKGHKIDHFGELLLYGNYTVLKGEGAKEVEREHLQYKVYLFERILLCCKEINPNKPKNKMLGQSKPLVDKKGKLKLQLKGRIFMQNVTDVLTLTRSDRSSFTVQIFWKGDPGVENFVIRFPDEATMVSWRETVQAQKKNLSETRASSTAGTSATEFSYLKNQPPPVNPYREEDDGDEDEAHAVAMGKSIFPTSRNASNTSLRSTPGQAGSIGRMQHPRIPLPEHGNGTYNPPLSVNTNIPVGSSSPGDFAGHSYFSPGADSPVSTRSSQASMYNFPRQPTQPAGWTPVSENLKHRTAPAPGRAPSREGYARPSLPPNMALAQQYNSHHAPTSNPAQQSRLRSTSTPNIQNGNDPRAKRPPNGPPSDPVPPIPHNMRTPINRSQTTSPINGQLPIRSPPVNYDSHGQRQASRNDNPPPRYPPANYGAHLGHAKGTQIGSTSSSMHSEDSIPYPPQIKVKVWYDNASHYVTIVVNNTIMYRTLADRIDSKMLKIAPQSSIMKGTAKLTYEDAERDLLTVKDDDDVQMAIEDWGSQHEAQLRSGTGLVDDFELIWQERS